MSATSGQSWWSKLRASCHQALKRLAPRGYEDKTGFHMGQQPNSQPEQLQDR